MTTNNDDLKKIKSKATKAQMPLAMGICLSGIAMLMTGAAVTNAEGWDVASDPIKISTTMSVISAATFTVATISAFATEKISGAILRSRKKSKQKMENVPIL